jgi:predicted nuclease of predicted toxin-antitoxin system
MIMPAFFADECISTKIVAGLRKRGFDVVEAKDVCMGDSDKVALSLSATAGRIMITDDWGFGELAVRLRQPAIGVIILGLYALPVRKREDFAVERIAALADTFTGCITIIEPGRERRRPLLSAYEE